MHLLNREVLDLGATGTTVGDVNTGSGNLTKTQVGAVIGTYVFREETVRVSIPGGLETRRSTQWFELKGGTIATMSLLSTPQGAVPTTTQQYVIAGGTGVYSGAAGSMTFTPLGPTDFRAVFHFVK